MTSGRTIPLAPRVTRWLLLVPIGLLLTAHGIPDAFAHTDTLDALLEDVSAAQGTEIAFYEGRSSALLSAPLPLQGVLSRPREGAWQRDVLQPYRERATIEGEHIEIQREGQRSRQFSLRRAPELGGLLVSFRALFDADRALLEAYYTLNIEGDSTSFVIRMTPRDRHLAKRIQQIELRGGNGELRCMTMIQTNGEDSRLWLGSLAAEAQSTADATLRRALCSHPSMP